MHNDITKNFLTSLNLMDAIRTLRFDDEEYPPLLREISHPPKTLYYRGTLEGASRSRVLAVVGTRRMTSLGRRACEMLVAPLAQAQYSIVSGCAYGIDTVAHSTALAAGGVTIAVLATGVDDESIYPQENRTLVHRMIDQGGCVLSEYSPGTTPRKEYFPQRNRIVAGMSHGVLIVEAPEKSGALITAFRALNENREVFSVPGPITQHTYGGANLLLKLGAHVTTRADDIFHVFGDTGLNEERRRIEMSAFSEQEGIILECISAEPVLLDEIVDRTKLDIRVVHSTLGMLELKGLIQATGNGRYIKK